MMPGVGGDRGAVDGTSESADRAKQRFLNNDGDDQHEESEWRGPMVRQKNFANARNCQSSGRGKNAKGDDNSRERFRLAVTIGMGGIGWTRGKSQPAPNDDRARGVKGGFDTINSVRANTKGRKGSSSNY